MILRKPDFYDKFKCTASKCTDTCCIGWEIDIDKDSQEVYRKVAGTFGGRNRICRILRSGVLYGVIEHRIGHSRIAEAKRLLSDAIRYMVSLPDYKSIKIIVNVDS